MVKRNTEEDFWPKVDRSGGESACWPWTGFRARAEGRFALAGKHIAAHQMAYRYMVGPLPKGTPLSHTCGDRYCCNPRHLVPHRKTSPKDDLENAKQRLLNAVQYTDTGCWLYMRYVNRLGYGLTNYRGKTISAHRLMWRLHNGSIPAGAHVRHTCDTPACINPSHLVLGSHKDNMADRKQRGQYARAGVRLLLHQVRKIRSSTESVDALAAKYGVRPGTIRAIRNGVSWKNDEPYRKIPLDRQRRKDVAEGVAKRKAWIPK